MGLGLRRHTAGTQCDSRWEVQLHSCLMTQRSRAEDDSQSQLAIKGEGERNLCQLFFLIELNVHCQALKINSQTLPQP